MQNPTRSFPSIKVQARGLNDQDSALKLKKGYVPFALNVNASSDVWSRREGRDMEFFTSGVVLYIGQITWQDNTSSEISQIGGSFYDMGNDFTYLLANGTRLYIQSSDGSYWDCTPGSNGLIFPTTIGTGAPGATPQTANIVLTPVQKFGFIRSDGKVDQLDADEANFGWFLNEYTGSIFPANVTTDVVFTFASGFSIRIEDVGGNTWVLSMTNDGNLIATTI